MVVESIFVYIAGVATPIAWFSIRPDHAVRLGRWFHKRNMEHHKNIQEVDKKIERAMEANK